MVGPRSIHLFEPVFPLTSPDRRSDCSTRHTLQICQAPRRLGAVERISNHCLEQCPEFLTTLPSTISPCCSSESFTSCCHRHHQFKICGSSFVCCLSNSLVHRSLRLASCLARYPKRSNAPTIAVTVCLLALPVSAERMAPGAMLGAVEGDERLCLVELLVHRHIATSMSSTRTTWTVDWWFEASTRCLLSPPCSAVSGKGDAGAELNCQ